MNDDYLWDGSGEPDPAVQRLERVLVKYRYQPAPPTSALSSHLSALSLKRTPWMKFAAAATILIVLGALALFKLRTSEVTRPELNAGNHETMPDTAPPRPAADPAAEQQAHVSASHSQPTKSHRQTYRRAAAKTPREEPASAASDFVAERQPILIPFIDVMTARHLEQAQLLLRSFRNSRDAANIDVDVVYERERSRRLLSENVVLRRDAEAKGNLPAEDVLSSLEPFLLDIANLPDRPSGDDLRSIKERMQKKQIVSALQIYSAPTLSQVF